MTTNVDQRGRDAAVALKALVSSTVDADELNDAYETAIGARPRDVSVLFDERPFQRRRSSMIAVWAVATAAAVLLVVVVISRNGPDTTPNMPPPSTDVTSTIPATTTTTTVAAQPDATTALKTIGSVPATFAPYPPSAVSLADGRVLLIVFDTVFTSRFDLLDPLTGEVETAGRPLVTRSAPAMVVLRDGRVLITVGEHHRCGHHLGTAL